ncbi:SDR family NAD(P)-dependent oxidoreductase [Burkholderia anthina]|uniref:SDR family NAD(P)-dependent oxidoreductase n=1 Tax=Burkholderia anthina TaxID=179879 RepID=UPI0037CB047C
MQRQSTDFAGGVINVASVLGLCVARQVVAWTVCKGGVVRMATALVPALARHRIRVNAIAPGTDAGAQRVTRIPMRRPGEPNEPTGS